MGDINRTMTPSDMIQILMDENQQLQRANSILRQELKDRLVSEWMGCYDMSEERAEQNADQYIIQMVAHNEGAE